MMYRAHGINKRKKISHIFPVEESIDAIKYSIAEFLAKETLDPMLDHGWKFVIHTDSPDPKDEQKVVWRSWD